MMDAPPTFPSKGAYVLYDNDPDGLAAALSAWLRFRDSATYIPVEDRKVPPPTPNASAVYILDFSYPREVMENLAATVPIVQLLDHHKSAMDELGDLPYCKFCMEMSGAGLAWEYFQGTPLPAFIAYIQDADIWDWMLPFSKEIHMAVNSYPLTFDCYQRISGLDSPRDLEKEANCLSKLTDDGEVILRYAMQQVDNVLENERMATFRLGNSPSITFDDDAKEGDGVFSVPVVNTAMLQSEACNELLQRHPDAKFAAYYYDAPHSIRQWGLRSRDDFDVSKVAEKFGGGGHFSASGFRTAVNGDQRV